MTELDSSRIERLLEKLAEIRRRGLSCFGSNAHHFQLNPPIDRQSLENFERDQGITLPSDYRSFLILAGNGGAGPYYGIYKLEQWRTFLEWTTKDIPDDVLSLPSPLHPGMSEEWESELEWSSPYQGLIAIGSQGCSYEMGLIVSGKYSGRVVYVDADGRVPFVVREPDFVTWYERWLDELLGGYDLGWFGFGVGGDESHLLGLINNPETPETERFDAVFALARLPDLSPEGRERVVALAAHSNGKVRAASCWVAEKFRIENFNSRLTELLEDEFPEVQKAAIVLAEKIAADSHLIQVISLIESADADVAYRAFNLLNKRGKLNHASLLRLICNSPHSTLRACATNAIQWSRDDEKPLIQLLSDESAQVRLFAVRSLCQLSMKGSLPSVIDLLDRETDCHVIDAILKMLGEVPGEQNANVLLEWCEKPDDFQKLAAIDGMCRLGDERVIPKAQEMLLNDQKPRRNGPYGFPTQAHSKSIREFVSESLRSSLNRKLKQLVTTDGWLQRFRFWR